MKQSTGYPARYAAPTLLHANSDVLHDRGLVAACLPGWPQGHRLRMAIHTNESSLLAGNVLAYSGYSYIDSATSMGFFEVVGLTGHTDYYYTFENNGVLNLNAADIGHFRTLPDPNGAAIALLLGTGSCWVYNANGHLITDTMHNRNFDYFILSGDLNYWDINADNDALFYYHFHRTMVVSTTRRFFLRNAVKWFPSDHDSSFNNGHAGTPGMTAFKRIYRKMKASYGVPADPTKAVYSASWIGPDLLGIYSDVRTERNNNADTDNSSKKLMQAGQLAWWQDLITRNNPRAFLNFMDMNFIGSAVAGQDDWRGFTNHRQIDICDHLIAQGKNGKWYVFCGDGHWWAIDDGSHMNFGTDTSKTFGGFVAASPMWQSGVTYPGFTVSHGSGNVAPSGGPTFDGCFTQIETTVTNGVTTGMTHKVYKVTNGGTESLLGSRTGIVV